MTPTDELVLDAQSVAVRLGGVRALDGVTVQVGPGELVGLIGPNGAGKTTFIDAVSGFVPSTGTVRFRGDDLVGRPPHERARLGMARTFQSGELFDDLSVRDNVQVAVDRVTRWSALVDCLRPGRGARDDRVDWALSVVGLLDAADAVPSELSHGHRKLAGIARALAAQPSLVLLDEPAAGLDTAESEALGVQLRSLREHGVAALLVDHDMSLVLGSCERIYVIDHGLPVMMGAASEIATDERVVAAYLGARSGS